MMHPIELDDHMLDYPGFYNIHPIENEISRHSKIIDSTEIYEKASIVIDDNYGRILNLNISSAYGKTENLNYYFLSEEHATIDELRVPFRKIAILKFGGLEKLVALIRQIENIYPDYEILLRGQTKMYDIGRTGEENLFLFGHSDVKEPSFKPSFVRSDFNELFIYGLWHSQMALLLNDVGVDLKKILPTVDYNEYRKDIQKIKNSFHFTPVSLGFAQHYGLPSVGLDLTKDIKVAAWFATNKLIVDSNGIATAQQLNDYSESTIFIFRCPKDTVFSHKSIKPKFIDNTRPDRQDAWFCHSGWGLAKNQLASNLICAVRLDSSSVNIFGSNYASYLFPDQSEDLILNNFIEMKRNLKNVGEVRRALNQIYSLER